MSIEEHIRKFGPFTSDLQRLADWLIEHHIETVVMESTGVIGTTATST